jgi:outer membrane protein TolC
VPLFLGGKSIAAIAASQDVSNALKQNVHVASNTVEREVIVAWNNVQATKAAIEATYRANQRLSIGIGRGEAGKHTRYTH